MIIEHALVKILTKRLVRDASGGRVDRVRLDTGLSSTPM